MTIQLMHFVCPKMIVQSMHFVCLDTSRKIVLNDLSKKTPNVHNDRINDMISSLWTFRVLLDKSLRTSFSTSVK